jgi:hypothetical protein
LQREREKRAIYTLFFFLSSSFCYYSQLKDEEEKSLATPELRVSSFVASCSTSSPKQKSPVFSSVWQVREREIQKGLLKLLDLGGKLSRAPPMEKDTQGGRESSCTVRLWSSNGEGKLFFFRNGQGR